jgi:hypothetical protein
MRLATLISMVLGLLVGVAAAYAPAPYWLWALYGLGLIVSAGLGLLLAAVLETYVERAARAWAVEALLLALLAAAQAQTRPLGALPLRPLVSASASAASVGAAGGLMVALGLGLLGLRSRDRWAQLAGGLTWLVALVALGPWLQKLR